MIKINLLPHEPGKRSAAAVKGPGEPSPAPFFALLALVYLLAIGAGYYVYSMAASEQEKVRTQERDLQKLKAEIQKREAEFEEQNLLSREIEEKYAVVEALGPENRIFWSEKINMIAMARMNLAVYVTKIELQEQIDEQETAESVARREKWKQDKAKDPQLKTPEPQAVKQPIINQTLVIHAIAYGNDSSQRLQQINAFSANLHNLSWNRESGEKSNFMDRLAHEFTMLPHKVEVVGGVEVIRFGFSITAEPQLDRTTKQPEADQTAASPAQSNEGGNS